MTTVETLALLRARIAKSELECIGDPHVTIELWRGEDGNDYKEHSIAARVRWPGATAWCEIKFSTSIMETAPLVVSDLFDLEIAATADMLTALARPLR